jgi:hypothetical protein
MKNITLVNVDEVISSALQEHFDISGMISENVFIDWHLPKENIDQITILEESIKNKSNVVLFDRYLSLKQHEVDWLLRYKNVYLFEPCLITRKGFQYMPFWYKAYDTIEWSGYDTRRQDIGVVHDSRIDVIGNDYSIPICNTYLDVDMTILFCSKREYKIGYLPDMTKILHSKCVPLLPGEHKYYWKLFQGLVVNNRKDLEWCLNVLRLYDALIYGIYDNMEKYFPEMIVDNVALQIKNILNL